MLMKRLGILALIAAMTHVAAGANDVRAQAQPESDPATCEGLLSDADRVASVLSGVPKYASTYVLIVPMRLADKVPGRRRPWIERDRGGRAVGHASRRRRACSRPDEDS